MQTKSPRVAALKKIISRFGSSSILVVGDCMMDKYIWGEVRRISPEAPVPIVHIDSESSRLGGAANVVQNLSALGVNPMLVSLCGRDADGEALREMLKKIGCGVAGLYASADRSTTVKTRVLAGHQQIIRIDKEITSDLHPDERAHLWKSIIDIIPGVRGVIISDYAKGVISQPFIGDLIKKCKATRKFVAIDPKERHFNLYKGVSVMTPNLKEAHRALGIPYRHCTDEDIQSIGWRVVKKYSLPYLLITLSERGMALFEREGSVFRHLPTEARKVFDVTGAGDTVISIYSAAITCGATPYEAAYLANHGAGLTVAELGTACVDSTSLLKACSAPRNL